MGRDCSYDRLGQRASCTDTQGDSTSFEYDAAGNQVATTDGLGVRTTCTFDAMNRRSSCTDRVGGVTRWSYDGNSNLTQITDAEGRVTRYTFDPRNLRASATFPDSQGPTDKVTIGYDPAGRQTSITDQAGQTRTFAYNAADRMIQKTDPDAKADTFTHDAVGRIRTALSSRYGTGVTRSYDAAGRLAAETLSFNGSYTVSYTYDIADRMTKLRYPDGSEVNRMFTARGQVLTVTRGTSQSVAQYTYDAGGRRTTASLGNGLVESREYRSDDRLSRINTTGAVGDFTYSYDRDKRKVGEGGIAVNGAQSFAYDGEGRMTSWSGGSGAQTWMLSLVGNWQSTTRNSTTETRTHNAAHELTAIGTNPLSYDPRGNLVQDDLGNALAWDFDNKMVTYTNGDAGTVAHAYDALGRRVGRVDGGVTTVYVYSGEEVVAEYVASDLSTSYILGSEIDRPIAFVSDGAPFWYRPITLGPWGR